MVHHILVTVVSERSAQVFVYVVHFTLILGSSPHGRKYAYTSLLVLRPNSLDYYTNHDPSLSEALRK